MNKWRFDLIKTQQRYKKLSDFYHNYGLCADNFSCKNYKECLLSQKKSTVVKQFCGGTAGLMPLYDSWYEDVPIRVLVVGKENGYMANTIWGTSANFDEHSSNVLNCINWKKKNNHIKGTLLTLQRIYGIETEYVYSSYALSNVLRCAYQDKNNISNVSNVHDTMVMRENCMRYLIEEICILEPTLIITQGSWAIKESCNFVSVLSSGLNRDCCCIMKNSNGKYGLYNLEGLMCITSHHPAILGNWVKNFAPDSLWPMISFLKENGYIPNIDGQTVAEYENIAKEIVDPILRSMTSNDKLRSIQTTFC